MKREEVKTKLLSIRENEDVSIDEILDALMNENGKDVNKANAKADEAKGEVDKLKSELKELQAAKDEADKANLTQEELMQKKLAELDAKQAELDIRSNRVTAASKLNELGLSSEDSDKILDLLVSADAVATEKAVTAFAEVFANHATEIEASTKKALLAGTPAPAQNKGASNGIDKATFDSMSYSERLQVYNENPDLYEQLTKE